jgi:hypothetical protein
VRDLPLLGVAAGAGVAAGLLQVRVRSLREFGAWASGTVAGLAALFVVEAVDPFVPARDWRYAPAGCDLSVAFARRAEIVAGDVRLAAGTPARRVTRALLTDVGEATTYSAECVVIGRALGDAEKPAVLDAAEALLKSAAGRLRLKVERVARAGGETVVLVGSSDEGRTAANDVLMRRAEARAVLGDSSLLVLWAWRVGREGDTAPFGEAFFASVRPARSAPR